jgi:hypothetical protein
MGAKPPFNGTLGTDDRPTVIETELIELLTTDAGSLVGVAEGATSTDGTVIYPSATDPQGVPTDLAVQIDGASRPVTGMEYVDGTGTARPVTQWHLGPLGEFTLTLDSLTFVQPATFDVAIASAGSAQPGGTLDVTADITNTGDESGTQTVTLDINNSVGQVDSTSVTLSGGGSTTQTLSWSVPSGQTEQDYTATVASADDSASQTVTVGSAVPSSAIHRWKLDDVATGTATDSIGSADGTVNGVASVSGTYQGGSAGDGDGSNDYIDVGTLGSFGSNRSTDFAVGITIDDYTGSGGDIFDVNDIDGNIIQVATINGGGLRLSLRGESGSLLRVDTSNSSLIDDGNKHRILWNKTANSASGFNVYVDNSQVSLTTLSDDSGFSPGDFDLDIPLFASANPVDPNSGNLDAVLDDWIIYGNSLSSSERADDYNIQPWS